MKRRKRKNKVCTRNGVSLRVSGAGFQESRGKAVAFREERVNLRTVYSLCTLVIFIKMYHTLGHNAKFKLNPKNHNHRDHFL